MQGSGDSSRNHLMVSREETALSRMENPKSTRPTVGFLKANKKVHHRLSKPALVRGFHTTCLCLCHTRVTFPWSATGAKLGARYVRGSRLFQQVPRHRMARGPHARPGRFTGGVHVRSYPRGGFICAETLVQNDTRGGNP